MNVDVFRGQAVIITGASAGIGRAMAIALARQGARLSIAARRVDRLEEVAQTCRAMGADILVIPTDVSIETQCKLLVEQTVASFGRLDMLVCDAGLAASALFEEFPDLNLFRHTMEINLYGAIYCTYYALPYLKQAKGRILAISSLAGKTAIPYNTPYCTSKYGLHGFYDSLRMELYKHGVSITLVCPWWVATEFHAAQLNKDGVPRGAARGQAMYTSKTMTAERCAEIALNAADRRRREVLMGPGALATWLKVIAPGLLDWLAVKIFLEPVIHRAKRTQAKTQQEPSKKADRS